MMNTEECCVCFCECIARLTPCDHFMCCQCALRWFDHHYCCPVCRQLVASVPDVEQSPLPLLVIKMHPGKHLGLSISARDGAIFVADAYVGASAHDVGLRRGDCITHINGIGVYDEMSAIRIIGMSRKHNRDIVVSLRRPRRRFFF